MTTNGSQVCPKDPSYLPAMKPDDESEMLLCSVQLEHTHVNRLIFTITRLKQCARNYLPGLKKSQQSTVNNRSKTFKNLVAIDKLDQVA